jgi:Fic family protein
MALHWFEHGPELDPVLKAAIAHVWFVAIHPFEDGNGRIARAVADLALARSEQTTQRFYSMSAQIRIERNAYYDTLERTQKDDLDITRWLDWFLGCLDRAFDGAEKILATVLNKARFWERHQGDTLNERQRKVITRLLNGFDGKLTSSKWAKLAKCSQDTALRDIDDLVKRSILVKDAGAWSQYELFAGASRRHGGYGAVTRSGKPPSAFFREQAGAPDADRLRP